MKKSTGKLITLFLAVIMLLGALSIMASAVTTISSVTVTGVTAPVAGATASWDFTIPGGKGYSKSLGGSDNYGYWSETSTAPTSYDDVENSGTRRYASNGSFTFNADKYYTFVAWIKADSGYAFSTNLSATINNKSAKVYETDSRIRVWYCFGKLAPPISSIEVTGVVAPVSGESASWDFTIPSGKGYSKNFDSSNASSCWVETDAEPTSKFDVMNNGLVLRKSDGSFTFKADKYYTFIAFLKADSGYDYASNFSSKVNGNTAKFDFYENYSGDRGDDVEIWYCFGKPATPISSIKIAAIETPVVGGAASWSFVVNKGCSIYTDSNGRGSYWSETSTEPTSYSDVLAGSRKYRSDGVFTFKADKYYTFVAFVKADSGYQITNSPTAQLDSTAINVYTGYSDYFPVWYCFGKPPTIINSVSVTGVTAPVIGATASWDFTLPSGRGYSKYIDSKGNCGYWSETSTEPTTRSEVEAGVIKYKSDGSFTFKADKYYTFVAFIGADSGYWFSYDKSFDPMMNNQRAPSIHDRTFLRMRYCFGQPAARTLFSISVTSLPTKLSYKSGESFNKSGMVVTASYSNSNPAAVTSYTVTGGENLNCNKKTVTLSYTENGTTKTTTVPITVAHKETTLKAKAATCTATGLTAGKKCSVCGKVTVAQKSVAKKAHSYKTTTTKATTSKDGSTVKKCTVCGTQASKTAIYKVTSFKLSTTSYTYNGKAKTPSVTVKDSKGKTLKKDTDYTVKYPSGRKSIGKYNVTVTLKGKYSGTKSLSFTIVPKATSKITVTQTTTSIKATWSKVSGATGYKVYIYKGSKLVSSKTVSSKTTSYNFTKLTAGTNYTVKVKAYQTVSKVNYWSSTKSLATATKTKTPSITSVKAGSKSATVKWSNVSGENGYQVYYATSKNGTYKKGATTKANDIDATIKSLTKGKTYYFKVRAYKTADSGTVYSAWSAVKSVKAK